MGTGTDIGELKIILSVKDNFSKTAKKYQTTNKQSSTTIKKLKAEISTLTEVSKNQSAQARKHNAIADKQIMKNNQLTATIQKEKTAWATMPPALKKVNAALNSVRWTMVNVMFAGMAIAAVFAPFVKLGLAVDTASRKLSSLSDGMMDISQASAAISGMRAGTQFNFTEMADGLTEFVKAGFTVEESMTVMPHILDLATGGFATLGDAVTITAQIMHQFNIPAEEAGVMIDFLTKAANESATDVTTFGNAMAYVGPVADQAGWAFEEAGAAMMILANAGMRGTKSGTALRQALAQLVKPTDASMKAMKKYGISFTTANGEIKDASTLMRELSTIVSTFDTAEAQKALAEIFPNIRGRSGVQALIENYLDTGESIKDVIDRTTESGYAQQVAQTQYESATNKMAAAWGDFGEVFKDVSVDLVNGLADIVEGLNELADITPLNIKIKAQYEKETGERFDIMNNNGYGHNNGYGYGSGSGYASSYGGGYVNNQLLSQVEVPKEIPKEYEEGYRQSQAQKMPGYDLQSYVQQYNTEIQTRKLALYNSLVADGESQIKYYNLNEDVIASNIAARMQAFEAMNKLKDNTGAYILGDAGKDFDIGLPIIEREVTAAIDYFKQNKDNMKEQGLSFSDLIANTLTGIQKLSEDKQLEAYTSIQDQLISSGENVAASNFQGYVDKVTKKSAVEVKDEKLSTFLELQNGLEDEYKNLITSKNKKAFDWTTIMFGKDYESGIEGVIKTYNAKLKTLSEEDIEKYGFKSVDFDKAGVEGYIAGIVEYEEKIAITKEVQEGLADAIDETKDSLKEEKAILKELNAELAIVNKSIKTLTTMKFAGETAFSQLIGAEQQKNALEELEKWGVTDLKGFIDGVLAGSEDAWKGVRTEIEKTDDVLKNSEYTYDAWKETLNTTIRDLIENSKDLSKDVSGVVQEFQTKLLSTSKFKEDAGSDNEETTKLDILQQAYDAYYGNMHNQVKNAIELEDDRRNGVATSVDEITTKLAEEWRERTRLTSEIGVQNSKINTLNAALVIQEKHYEILVDRIDGYNESIQTNIDNLEELRLKYLELAKAKNKVWSGSADDVDDFYGGSGGGSYYDESTGTVVQNKGGSKDTQSVIDRAKAANDKYKNGSTFGFEHNDFISRPGQPAASFSPQDTIIGVKDTSKLGGGVTINEININGAGDLNANNMQDFAAMIGKEVSQAQSTR